jgi:hypothetical protein
MSGSPGHASVFAGLRPAVAARLVEVRSSLDPGFARLAPAAAAAQFEAVLTHQEGFLASGDPTGLRTFLRSFRAVRAAEGLGAENLLHAVIALGDVAIQVAQRDQPAGPRTAELVVSLARLNRATARLVVEIIAEELDGRVAQLRAIGARGGA